MKYPSWFISLYLVSLLLMLLIPLVSAEETYTFQWAVPSVVGRPDWCDGVSYSIEFGNGSIRKMTK